MKVSKEQAAENRERIIEVAAKLFREKGFEGIGVADLMKSAGLTHGGFYGHFASKEELMGLAVARAMADTQEAWNEIAEETSGDPLPTLISRYLSTLHRDEIGGGCVMAALAADVARQNSPVRHAVTTGFSSAIEFLSGLMPEETDDARREKALATYASLVGALVLSRAVDDEALSKEILRAVKGTILSKEK